jgi:hypothetical protein
MVGDESGETIHALIETLRLVAPDLVGTRGLRMILPRKLGELEKPEFLYGIKMKIRAIGDLQCRLKESSLDREYFRARLMEILDDVEWKAPS